MNWWKELFLIVCKDMQEPAAYIPQAMAVGLFVVLLTGIFRRITDSQAEQGRTGLLCWFFCAFYVDILLNTVFFSREAGSRIGIDLHLLGTWGETVQSQGYVVENVLLFIPFGILFPCCFRFMKNGFFCVFTGGLCSIGIELVQLVTERGYCQLDDVVMNTAGAAVGWCFYWIAAFIFTRGYRKDKMR